MHALSLISVTCQSLNLCDSGAECTMIDYDHYECVCPLGQACVGNCSGAFGSYVSEPGQQQIMCEGMRLYTLL